MGQDQQNDADAAGGVREDGTISAAILRTVQQPILVLDGALRVTAANPAFYRTFAVDAAQTLGQRLYDLGNGQWDIPDLRARLESILPADGRVDAFRVDHVFQGLGRRIMRVNACRMRRHGQVDTILLTIADQTETETIRERLVGEKEFIEKIFDASRDALLILDYGLRVRQANETFYRAFQVDPADTEGRLVYELGNGQWDIPELREALETILPQETSFDDFEVRHDFAGIGPRVMVLNARRVDHLQFILLAIEDRTETQQALDARDESAASFRAFVSASSDMIYTMSADWSTLRVFGGKAMQDAEGSAAFAWLGKFIPRSDHRSVLRAIRRAIRGRQVFEADHRILRPDGSIGWVHSRAVPVFAGDGSIREWFGAANDITQRLDAEAALRQSEDRQRFLLGLSDALQPLREPAEIEGVACRMLAERLQVDRAFYVELDWPRGVARVLSDEVRAGAASLAGEHAIADFRWSVDILQTGEVMAVSDTRSCARVPEAQRAASAALGIIACACCPLMKEGRLIGALCVTSATPRRWDPGQTAILRDVAARIQGAVQSARAEAKRRESDARYRLLFDSIDQGFCIIRMIHDSEGRPQDYVFVEVNAAFERQTGLIDPQGRRIRDMVPDLEDVWFETYGRIARTGQPERFEEVAHPLGAHYEVYAFPVGPPAFRQVGVLFTDVAMRKRAERALRDSEERLAAIFKEASVGLCEIDPTGRILRANDELARILGRPQAELAALTIADVTHPDDLGSSFAMIGRVLRGETVTPDAAHSDGGDASGPVDGGIDKRYLRPDGSIRWANSRASLLPVHDGGTTTLLVVTVDLTQRKAAEAAIRDSEERFRQFGDASSDGLWVWNVETRRWEYLSAAVDAICGIDSGRLLQTGGLDDFARIIHPDDVIATMDRFRGLVEGANSFDFRIIHPLDGQIRWLRITGFALLDNDGAVRRLGGIIHDMTEEVRISGRMKVLLAELQHRTRNLIGVVRAMSTRTLKTSTSLQDYHQRFGSRLEALARVNSLLSRLEEGDRVTFDELLLAEFKAHGIAGRDGEQVTLRGPNGVRLPSASVQTLALALHELLTNATKHGALSRPEGRLGVEWDVVTETAPMLRLTWRESGVAPRPARQDGTRYGGYGRELIERALPYQLGAETRYRLDETGLLCTVTLPLPPRAMEMRDA